MRVVESNQVSQSSHVCVRERCEIIRNLGPEFIQQCGKLVIGVSEHVTSIGIHNSGAKAFHHSQRVLRKRNRLFVARDPAAIIAVIEKANIASDPRALERPALEKLRVIVGQLMPNHFAKGRLQRAEQDCNVGDAAGHRARCVLLMGNWNNPILRDESDSRFQANDVLNGGWPRD
jgi:hypothetical protein